MDLDYKSFYEHYTATLQDEPAEFLENFLKGTKELLENAIEQEKPIDYLFPILLGHFAIVNALQERKNNV